MIPLRYLLRLEDCEVDYVFRVGFLVNAIDQKFLIKKGKDGDVTGLMIPVRSLLMLEFRRCQNGGVEEPTETRDHSRAIQVQPVTLPGAGPSV